uniref:Uncharacterized protein n=1 Tax=Panagrolaimus sp. ES5 TaxID=591445 RepID=A0AC34FFV2_9BILA
MLVIEPLKEFCNPRSFDLKNYENRNIVQKCQFEVFHNTKGAENSRLLIFDPNDRNFGYDYRKTDRFNCAQCFLFKKRVFAKLLTNVDGQQYVELSNVEHLCEKNNSFTI